MILPPKISVRKPLILTLRGVQIFTIAGQSGEAVLSEVSQMPGNKARVACTLYTGAGCHLCDLARDILDDVVGAAACEVVSITGNDQLTRLYGVRIPVVKLTSGEEKGWPFTAGQIRKMLPVSS
ncbi:MAG: hypothetical protein DRR06_02165 [Gammaproteobacteria bacterium]|nr:MAG: hypothetical protein DRR06_02165 [Gammaproteobacteria bacterium]